MYKIVITSYRRRAFDPDNIWGKPYIDEIVAAGVIPDDSSDYVELIAKRVIRVKDPQHERTVIEVFQS